MRKLPFLLMAAAVPLSVALAPSVAVSAPRASGPTAATTTCSAVRVSAPTGVTVESVTAVPHPGGTVTVPSGTVTGVPAYCEMTVTVTHPGAQDRVDIKVLLPQDRRAWNGRFQATGGSAYLAGDFAGIVNPSLVTALKDGYVAAATDAGVGQNPTDVSGWALTAAGTVNRPLLKDFASRSLHDMAVIGKNVARTFYQKPVSYSYWNGCSTGGRQGYQEAQDHPTDFQGILADSPAINWDRFAVATLWSQVVFHEGNVQPTPCEMEAFNTAAVKACDGLDGVTDGIIDNPQHCGWDPRTLVGETIPCDGEQVTISAATAEAVRKIWAGPVSVTGHHLWYGPNKGASFDYLAKTGEPFTVADSWVKYFVEREATFDTTTLTYRQFDRIFRQSQQRFHSIIGTDDPNLAPFARAGGKLLTWQGQSDQLVPTRGTIDYRDRVDRRFGGTQRVDDFYRLFLLPGVDHCGGGVGPQPTGALDALVTWVEQHRPPATLPTSTTRPDGTVVTRNVCRFPQVTHYTGHGDPAIAASYRCVKS